uniref:Uncharacterized protein n=1 Tax=viral metagenome TaxID=1070528 RepID=A0A6C0AFF7_9ZZZZ
MLSIDFIEEFFKDNMKIGKKKIYSFHLRICYDHLNELFLKKRTTCKSGFIREIIYKILKKLLIKYKLEIVDYKHKKSLCRWIGGRDRNRMWFYTPKMLLGYIKSNMVIEEEFIEKQEQLKIHYEDYDLHANYATLDEIKSLFNKNVADNLKLLIIENELETKWNIFENCNLYRPIKEIILI